MLHIKNTTAIMPVLAVLAASMVNAGAKMAIPALGGVLVANYVVPGLSAHAQDDPETEDPDEDEDFEDEGDEDIDVIDEEEDFFEDDLDFEDDIDIDTDRDDDVDTDDDDTEDGPESDDATDDADDDDYENERENDDDDDDEDERGSFELDELFEDDLEFDREGYPARRGEIIAFDLDAQTLRIAEDLGFNLIERRDLPTVGTSIGRLSVPREFATPGLAIDALEQAIPAAPFDYNYLYLLPEEGDETADLSDIHLGAAATGEGVRIGVIDTVPDTNHPSLREKNIEVRDFAGSGGRDFSHGTAVVSIIVGEETSRGYSGLLPAAQVYAANIFRTNTKGEPETDAFAMITALDWVAGKDVGVINVSLAGPPSDVLEDMLERLHQRGHVIVAAVGNDGPAAPPLFPSAYDGVVGVTAIDFNERPYRRAGRGEHVDLAAPGVRVRAAETMQSAYGSFTGTSFATPVAAALIALDVPVRQPGALDNAMPATRDLGSPGRDNVFGNGLVQTPRR